MSWYNRVVWYEGQFLMPQLFQQQERYLEYVTHQRSLPLSAFFWGFSQYNISAEMLHLGKLVLDKASGVFRDGTPFEAPQQTDLPQPLTILPEHLGQLIFLSVPVRMSNGEETSFDARPESLARFTVYEEELRDANSIGLGPKTVQLSHLRLRLLPEKAMTDAWIGLPVAKVKTLRPDGSVELDTDIIPPVNRYLADSQLHNWVIQVEELLKMRANVLAERLTGNDGSGVESAAEVSDYLLLQLLNRYRPLFAHWHQIEYTSPETIYQNLLMLEGELSTFVRPQTRLSAIKPSYQHETPYICFRPLINEITWLLNAVLIRSAERIELIAGDYGVYNALATPDVLRTYSSLVLAVKAQMTTEQLAEQFAAQTKIGSSERLPELIRSHLPGIRLQLLPVPPRQLPYYTGFVYYDIQRSGSMWEQIARSGGLALHVAGDFPELMLALWGVRE